jgi:hypothetical protein
MTEEEEFWEAAMEKFRAGGPHPLANHPLRKPCAGHPRCWVVGGLYIMPNWGKRYCAEHLPLGAASCLPASTT